MIKGRTCSECLEAWAMDAADNNKTLFDEMSIQAAEERGRKGL